MPVQTGKKIHRSHSALGAVLKVLLIIVETLLLVVLALYGAMYVVTRGPSQTARDRFVLSVRETSAIGFLANWFLTDEEIAAIDARQQEAEYVETDTTLVTINSDKQAESGSDGPAADAWGLVDEDGDGIIVDPVRGAGYNGYMMVVLDPSRVIMGSVPTSFGREGYTVAELVAYYDAVAGINAGGFYDPDGFGDGSTPDSIVVFNGQRYYAEFGLRKGFVGFDDNYIMHICNSQAEIEAANIQYGASFGPALVVNGDAALADDYTGGFNPRTAIGQRSDGAVLMLVIDGRQATSLGASFSDLMEIMLRYGAVNAYNLDGGSSSLMWYQGDYLNNKAYVIGVRDIPTSFLVLKKGASVNG